MKAFLEKDSSGNWNSIPAVPTDKIRNVNCHKFVLYISGKISWEEMISDPRTQEETGEDFTFGTSAKNISDLAFILVKGFDSLLSLADKNCKVGKSYIGQILDAQTGEMAHSFIVQRESKDTYACFDKPGFKYPFGVHGLKEIINFVNKYGEKSNQNQKWRFVPMKP